MALLILFVAINCCALKPVFAQKAKNVNMKDFATKPEVDIT